MAKFNDIRVEPITGNVDLAESSGDDDIVLQVSEFTNPGLVPFRSPNTVSDVDDRAPYLLVSATPNVRNGRILVAGDGVLITDNGPNDSLVISVNSASLNVASSIEILTSGSIIGLRPKLNFVAGENISLQSIENSALNRIDLFLSAKVSTLVSAVTFLGVNGSSDINVTGSPVTSSGNLTIALTNTGVSAGTYNSLTVNSTGRVTGGSNIPYISNVSINNLGAGEQVVTLSGANNLIQKTITGAGIINVRSTSTNIILSAEAINTVSATSLGFGRSIVESTIGNNIRLKSITAGGIIDVTSTGEEVKVSAALRLDVVSQGQGAGLVSTVSGSYIGLKSLRAGGIIQVSAGDDEIIFSAQGSLAGLVDVSTTGASANQVLTLIGSTWVPRNIPSTTVSSVGAGTSLLAPISAREIRVKSITGAGAITVSAGATTITISAAVPNVGLTEINLAGTDVSGILTVQHGGTGVNFVDAGVILYGTGLSALSSLTIGTSGRFLRAAGGIPAWTSAPLGALDGVNITGASANQVLTFTGSLWQARNLPAAATVTTSSIGTGTGLTSTNDGTELKFKSLVGSGSVTVSSGTNEVTINVPTVSAFSQLTNDIGLVSSNQVIGRGIIEVRVSGDGTTSQIIISAQGSLATLADANLTGASANQVLTYNGSIWQARNLPVTSIPVIDNISGYGNTNRVVTSGAITSAVDFYVENNKVATITPNGLGVGTNAPVAEIHVSKENSAQIRIESLANGGSARLTVLTSTNGTSRVSFADTANANVGSISYDHSDDRLDFQTSGVIRASITSAGRVGIGVNNPTELLHIEGTAKFQSLMISALGQFYKLPTSAGANTQVLTTGGNGSTLYWTTISGGGGGVTTLTGLMDVSIVNPSATQILTFDGAAWTARNAPASVIGSSKGVGAAVYAGINSSELHFKSILGGGIVQVSAGNNEITISAQGSLAGLTDTSTTGASANQVLTFVSGIWQARNAIAAIVVSSKGAGAVVATASAGSSTTELVFRTIVGSGIIQVSGGASTIAISASPGTLSGLIDVSAVTVSANQVLVYNGTQWLSRNIDLTIATGTLSVSKGGTGLTAIASGALLYGSNTGNAVPLAIGVSGRFLRSVAGAPAWVSAALGALDGVNLTGASAGQVLTLVGTNWVAKNLEVTVSSKGSGASVAIGNEVSQITFRSIVGNGTIEVSSGANEIVLSGVRTNYIVGNNGSNFVSDPIALSGAFAIGNGAIANQNNSFAIGASANVSGRNSFVIGNNISITSTDNVFALGNNGVIKIFADANGRIGLGTISPTSMLTINDTGSDKAQIKFTNSITGSAATDGLVIGLASASSNVRITNNENSDLYIENNGVETIRIDSSGYTNYRGAFISTLGDIGHKQTILKGTTSTSGVQTWLTMANASEMVMPNNTAWMFDIDLVGKIQSGTIAAGYKYKGVITRGGSAAATTFVNPPIEDIYAESVSAYGWSGGVSASPSIGGLRVFGLVSSLNTAGNVNWVSFVKITEIKI